MYNKQINSPEISKGENFPFLVWSSTNLDQAEKVKIVLVGHGSIQDHGPEDQLPVLDNEFSLYTDRLVDQKNIVAVAIALPRYEDCDVQILDAPVFSTKDLPKGAYRADIEMLQIIKDIRKKYQDLGYRVQEKISGIGISAGANLINRLSTIYPTHFDKIALLMAGSFMYPVEKNSDIPLNYPSGIGGLSSIIGKPDINSYDNIAQYVYVGREDTNPGPINYEYHLRPAELEIVLPVVGNTTLERTQRYYDFIKRRGVKCVLDIQDEAGHHVTPDSLDKAVDFLLDQGE